MVLVGLLLALTPAAAQTFGEITGSVTDASGAVIAGAKVTVTNSATGVPRSVESNEAGNYNVPFLNPGIYSITAELEGFKTVRVDNRQVQVGDRQLVNIVLEVGAVTEVIEVQAGAEMLDTSSTALGTVIDQQRIVELPINGRNYLSLVKLSPNVTAEMGAGGQADGRQGGERANQPLSISGQRQQFNRFTLDGIDNTDSDFNTFVVRPSVEALQEFKVQTGVYSAEYGKATSQINVTTRAGSNEFHGSLFEFLRNDAIQANQWNNTNKPPFRRNQFGGTVTGPIVKNKFFFMGNYEGLRETKSRYVQATTADSAMRSGDFSNPALLPIYDPDTIRASGSNTFTADPFPNRIIPQARFKQPFIKLLEFLPDPNVAGAVPGRDPYNYERNTPSPVDWDQFTTRIDFNENPNAQWFGRYSWGREAVGLGATFPIQDRSVSTRVDQIMLSNTRTFSPTIVNELRLGANIFDNDLKTLNNGVRDVSGELGIPGLPPVAEAAWGSPQIGMSGVGVVAGWGESTEGPFINRSRTYQIFDNLSIIRGNHTFKFGGEIGNRRYNLIGNQFPRGLLQFHSRATALPGSIQNTGDRFASGLLGWMDEATRALGLPNVQLRQTAFHVYAEDSWKVTPKLTLTMGLRYENTPPWADRYRGMMNVQLFCPGVDNTGIDESCPTPVMVRPGPSQDFYEGLNVRYADNVPTASGDDILYNHALQQRDKNDFAPRLGIAYQVNQKMSIRTGYGVFYTQDTTNPVFDRARNFGFRESARGLDTRPSVNLDSPWASSGASGLQCTNWDGVCVARLYTFAGDARRRTPYVQQFMFNVQYQLDSSSLLEVGYSGNVGHKIERMYGYNTPLDKAGPLDQTTRLQRIPWGDAYGRIQTINNVVNSNYNALGLKFQRRFTQGFTYLVGYTWGRAIDNGSALRTNSGDNLFPASSYNLGAERGLSQFHQAHRLTTSILYEVPLKFQNPVAEAIAGGWQVGSIITIATGSPYNGGNCGDTDGNEQGNRGDATGISPFLDNPSNLEYFAKSSTGRGAAAISCSVPDPTYADINQLSYRQGNIARNMYIGPGVANWDFSLSKNFRVTEGSHVEFRFESFNFANHPQWNFPDTGVTSLNYGRITSARDMRTNQFALKFLF
ncbi:MAG: TonB-dependent receptor [Bryobacterales bacterium]|nr:TonB-dependent receptor [Bryobacterales bacterium]